MAEQEEQPGDWAGPASIESWLPTLAHASPSSSCLVMARGLADNVLKLQACSAHTCLYLPVGMWSSGNQKAQLKGDEGEREDGVSLRSRVSLKQASNVCVWALSFLAWGFPRHFRTPWDLGGLVREMEV